MFSIFHSFCPLIHWSTCPLVHWFQVSGFQSFRKLIRLSTCPLVRLFHGAVVGKTLVRLIAGGCIILL